MLRIRLEETLKCPFCEKVNPDINKIYDICICNNHHCMGHYLSNVDLVKIIELKQKAYEEGYEKAIEEIK